MDLGLDGRVCVITGASRGIGLATARLLAAEGAKVLGVGRDAGALEAAARECREVAAGGGEVDGIALDVTAPDAGERLRAGVEERYGPADVLVNNAGTSRNIPLEELSEDDWGLQWSLNVLAPWRLMAAFAPGMAERGWGRVVNVTSSSGKRPSASNVAYSVTKAAQASLSRAFADAYAGRGVLVNAVAPGVVASSLWTAEGGLADQAAAAAGTSREQALAAAARKMPRGRLGEPEEIAAVIAFLCSVHAANVAGAHWSVDGGTVASIV